MTSKQRVLASFAHEKTDRMPINYLSNPTVHNRLAAHLGIPNDMESMYEALQVDFRGLMPDYTGKPLFHALKDRNVDPLYGSITRWVANKDGGYWDYCDFPLKDQTDEIIANWPLPSADDFDYDSLLEACKHFQDKAIHLGHAGLCDIMNSFGMLRGMEDTYVDMLLETEGSMVYLDRRIQFQLEWMERSLEKCKDYVAFMWTGEDLGTQHTPLISMEVFKAQIRPRHQKMVDLAKAYNKPVMIHCCGSSSWAYNDFIEMGITGADTLQPEATHMDPVYLAKTYGDKMMFHGCISTAKLSTFTADEVTENVREIIDIMKPNHAYCVAPTHMIQDNTPVENIVAMYDSALRYGVYQ